MDPASPPSNPYKPPSQNPFKPPPRGGRSKGRASVPAAPQAVPQASPQSFESAPSPDPFAPEVAAGMPRAETADVLSMPAIPDVNGAVAWRPDLFGPLLDDPAKGAKVPPQLFPGEHKFLSKGKVKKRLELQRMIWPRVQPLLQPGEQVLAVVPAYQIPPLLHQISLGAWWLLFHQVALVLTDRRLIELELGLRGKSAATRVRSFAWPWAGELHFRGSRLRLKGGKREKHQWQLGMRGDKKLFKLLVPKLETWRANNAAALEQQVMAQGGGWPLLEVWHCPRCSRVSARSPRSCDGCATQFRSRGMASLLALAFPGCGLLYAGHPVLAFFDLCGELFLLGVAAMMALEAGSTPELIAAVGVAAFLLFLTKAESVHLAHILVDRTKPVSGSNGLWKGIAGLGAVLTVAALAMPMLFAGSLAPTVDNDLDLLAAGWERESEVEEGGFDPFMLETRAHWHGPEGEILAVSAYPLSFSESLDDMGFVLGTAMEETHIAGLQARYGVQSLVDVEGQEFSRLVWAVYDPDGHDVHVVSYDVESGMEEEGRAQATAVLSQATWSPAADAS